MTAAPTTLGEHDVLLGGYLLPVKERLQVTKATQVAGKVTIGSSQRSDQVSASSESTQ